MKYGYARVSTDKIYFAILALKQAGCEHIFYEKMSGSNKKHYESLKAVVISKGGDSVIVWNWTGLGARCKT